MLAALTAAAHACRKLFQLRLPNTNPVASTSTGAPARARPAVLRLGQQHDTARPVDPVPGQPERLTTAYPGEHRELDQIGKRRIPALPTRGEQARRLVRPQEPHDAR